MAGDSRALPRARNTAARQPRPHRTEFVDLIPCFLFFQVSGWQLRAPFGGRNGGELVLALREPGSGSARAAPGSVGGGGGYTPSPREWGGGAFKSGGKEGADYTLHKE